MTELSALMIGFLLGLRHALDADHVATVAALATRSQSVGETIRTGLAWGLGHAATLLAVCILIIVFQIPFAENIAGLLEFFVGLILLWLGLDVILRVLRGRIHVHLHSHVDRGSHIHFHSHKNESDPTKSIHNHEHHQNMPFRALSIGTMHGLAGSAALLLLSLSQETSIVQALIYIILFAFGSIIGMGILSAVIAWPIMASARKGIDLFKKFNLLIGGITALIGSVVISHSFQHLTVFITKF